MRCGVVGIGGVLVRRGCICAGGCTVSGTGETSGEGALGEDNMVKRVASEGLVLVGSCAGESLGDGGSLAEELEGFHIHYNGAGRSLVLLKRCSLYWLHAREMYHHSY